MGSSRVKDPTVSPGLADGLWTAEPWGKSPGLVFTYSAYLLSTCSVLNKWLPPPFSQLQGFISLKTRGLQPRLHPLLDLSSAGLSVDDQPCWDPFPCQDSHPSQERSELRGNCWPRLTLITPPPENWKGRVEVGMGSMFFLVLWGLNRRLSPAMGGKEFPAQDALNFKEHRCGLIQIPWVWISNKVSQLCWCYRATDVILIFLNSFGCAGSSPLRAGFSLQGLL